MYVVGASQLEVLELSKHYILLKKYQVLTRIRAGSLCHTRPAVMDTSGAPAQQANQQPRIKRTAHGPCLFWRQDEG